MPRTSAGLLPWRRSPGGGLEVFVARMGGPFWQGREAGAWSIVKGELAEGEEPLAAALREFAEETGLALGDGRPVPLTPVRQAGGKVVIAFALHAPDLDPALVRSNSFPVEWPRGSGKWRHYPEIERAAWLAPAEARGLIVKGQIALMDELERRLLGGADLTEESPA